MPTMTTGYVAGQNRRLRSKQKGTVLVRKSHSDETRMS